MRFHGFSGSNVPGPNPRAGTGFRPPRRSGTIGTTTTNTFTSLPRPAVPRGLQRLTDSPVLADPPEVDRNQERHHDRNGHAMQDVKPVQRLLADVPGPQQEEPGIARVRDQVVATDVE